MSHTTPNSNLTADDLAAPAATPTHPDDMEVLALTLPPLPTSPSGPTRTPSPPPAPRLLPTIPPGATVDDDDVMYNGLSTREWPFLPPGQGPPPCGRVSAPLPKYKKLGAKLDEANADVPPEDGFSICGNSSTTSSLIGVRNQKTYLEI